MFDVQPEEGQRNVAKGWMLFDCETGNAIDMTMDPEIAKLWKEEMYEDEDLAVITFTEGGFDMADEEFEPKEEEGPEEPADDTAEAQPSIEREGAPTGRTGSGSPGAGETGGIGSAGNPG